MISILTLSTGPDLTDLASVQEILGAPSSDEPLLQRVISRASRWAETYIGQPLSVQIYAESVPAFGGRHLMLSRVPIRGVTGIYDSTTTCTATNYSTQTRIEDADAGLLSRDEGFAWTALQADSIADTAMPNTETRPWYVIYEAGYSLAGTTSTVGGTTSTGRTLPDDIEAGVIEKVKQIYGGMVGITSKRVGDLQVSYRSEGPDVAEQMLALHRRVI